MSPPLPLPPADVHVCVCVGGGGVGFQCCCSCLTPSRLHREPNSVRDRCSGSSRWVLPSAPATVRAGAEKRSLLQLGTAAAAAAIWVPVQLLPLAWAGAGAARQHIEGRSRSASREAGRGNVRGVEVPPSMKRN